MAFLSIHLARKIAGFSRRHFKPCRKFFGHIKQSADDNPARVLWSTVVRHGWEEASTLQYTMLFTPSTIAALVVAASFAAGLNVYATVLTLGLLAHAHWVLLPPGLETLSSWWIIGISGALFAAEFVADKIPGFDLLWNAMHTFIRIPVAALLAFRASSQLTPGMQILATAVGGAVALAAHSSKTAARALVTPSPEPVSNIALSGSEDVAAIGLTWLATQHPMVAGGITLALLLVSIFMVRWVVKALRGVVQKLLPAPAH